ncbi:uncharacterized protein LOC122017501 [Zingiber officinale]|uniref:uncharacterized protein LOC122017501 n=1 Tax=Zingiber officinale TaxID=94328 RepID=UPI001C4CCEBA|nr:uncharacterized protein LOC122017501 [Zingiber officinale]
MEDVMKGPYKVPSFGSWNFYEEKHVDGFVQAQFFVEDGEELFEVLRSYKHLPQERKKEEKKKNKPRAVDDDLYKIPPELLCQIPKKRNLLKNFWAGCLCLSCMA